MMGKKDTGWDPKIPGGNPVLPQTSWKTIGKSWKASVSLSTLDWMIWKSCHSPRFCMAVKVSECLRSLKDRYAPPPQFR